MKAGVLIAVILFGLLAGSAAGTATITFNKPLDVPDRDFRVTYEGSTFSFTIADVGNYKIGENVGVTVSGGVNNMRLVLFTVDKLTPWVGTFHDTGGSVSATIPANKFDVNCPDVCDDSSGGYKMGPGIYALAVQNLDNSNYFIAKPIIISKHDLTVTPGSTQANAGNTIKLTVNISMNGVPVNVAPNNVNVEFLQDSTSTYFGSNAIATTIPGTYETNIQIPSSASGVFRLYAAITTSRNIYQDYPETIGAASGANIAVNGISSTPTPSPTSSPLTSSSGGGGGGGGGPSGEEFKNIESIEAYEKYIAKDVPTSYVFRQAGNPVDEIVIIGNINAGDTNVKAEILRSTSTLVNNPPPGQVYKNINMWVGTYGFAVPKNIKEAVIKFKVENSWLVDNKLAGGDVKMVRWDGIEWMDLETSEKNKDRNYTYYEAKTTSFSSFAITGLKSITATNTPEITETGKTVTAAVSSTAEPEHSVKVTPGFKFVTGMLAALSSLLVLKKKRK
jgi:PGF-pre-PGF domain-containing protein